MLVLDQHEARLWTGDGLADRDRIRGIALAPLPAHTVRRHELGGRELDLVSVLPKQARPVMGSGAGFHADNARRQLRDQCKQLGARNLRLDHRRLAIFIDAVHGRRSWRDRYQR